MGGHRIDPGFQNSKRASQRVRNPPGNGRQLVKGDAGTTARTIPAQSAKKDQAKDKEKEELHRKVGQLTMEVDFLAKKCKQLGIPGKGRNS